MLSFELEPKGEDVMRALTHQRIAPEFRYEVLAGMRCWDILQPGWKGNRSRRS